jgi:hypothetical protein
MVGTILAYHTITSRHWTTSTNWNCESPFAEEYWHARYSKVLSGLSALHSPPFSMRFQDCQLVVKSHWRRCLETFLSLQTALKKSSPIQIASSLIREVQRHNRQARNDDTYDYCNVCWIKPWLAKLPCLHGICRTCINGRGMSPWYFPRAQYIMEKLWRRFLRNALGDQS